MKSIFIVAIVAIGSYTTYAQPVPDRFTISGYVRDSARGEELIGANIIITDLPSTGATTNAYGFYSITLPAGLYTLVTQYVGYQSVRTQVSLDKNIRLDFSVAQSINRLSEVVISSEPDDANVTNTRMGVEKIEIREIENIPVLMVERDVLKTLQLKPGVKSAGEGNSGFYVRGGTADQNLILLDEASVFNASHLLGFFSVFNSDALKDITFFKGTQPAEYGSRLSSVLDIRMQEGNDRRFGFEGGIGLISSRLKVEGPIVKEKGS
ncbi:MAG TPA: TonB-dependent receptor, partial [Cyclobacteriaceae bacterium]|nr:TonB-dependent receptor [Cyclobacteriaceae bacterium]